MIINVVVILAVVVIHCEYNGHVNSQMFLIRRTVTGSCFRGAVQPDSICYGFKSNLLTLSLGSGKIKLFCYSQYTVHASIFLNR